MTAAYVAHQAAAFLDWLRGAGLEAEPAFGHWAASKGLTEAEYAAVWQVVHAELVARGVCSLTELPEWAGDAGDDADGEQDARAAA